MKPEHKIVDGVLMCPECDGPMKYNPHFGVLETLVGYISPPGHDHNINCESKIYICENGHRVKVSKRKTCPACDWKQKEECFCHNYKKVDEYPQPHLMAL